MTKPNETTGADSASALTNGLAGGGCSRCGCTGIHACTGAPIPPWTDEEKERLAEALQFVTDKCRRCGGKMSKGKAIAQTFNGMPDFPGGDVVTISPGGPGRLIDCLKCSACGHSVTAND